MRRYLELVEFSVMLLQAPAESVTQTIIYARQNVVAKVSGWLHVGGGMVVMVQCP
jgi:hypothetical protein